MSASIASFAPALYPARALWLECWRRNLTCSVTKSRTSSSSAQGAKLELGGQKRGWSRSKPRSHSHYVYVKLARITPLGCDGSCYGRR